MLYDEANLVIERINGQTVTEGLLIQRAVMSMLSTAGQKAFNTMVDSLQVQSKAIKQNEG